MSKADNRTRYETRIFRALKQRNGDRTVKHKTFLLALFFLYSSLALVLSLSLFVSLDDICKTESSSSSARAVLSAGA